MRFEDKNIEEEYLKSNRQDDNKKSVIFCVFSLIIYIICIGINIVYINFHPNRSTWILIGGLFLDLVQFLTTNIPDSNRIHRILKNVRFFAIYLILTMKNRFPVNKPDSSSCSPGRVIVGFITVTSSLYIYYLDFNINQEINLFQFRSHYQFYLTKIFK